MPTNQQLGTPGAQTESNTRQQQSEVSKVTLKKLAQVPDLSQNKKERLLSHGTAGLQMPPLHPTQQTDKPGPGWECNTLPAAEGRASPGLLLRCGAVCRETKPRKAQSCLVAWNVEMGLHTQ